MRVESEMAREQKDLGGDFGLEPLNSFKGWRDVVRAVSRMSPELNG